MRTVDARNSIRSSTIFFASRGPTPARTRAVATSSESIAPAVWRARRIVSGPPPEDEVFDRPSRIGARDSARLLNSDTIDIELLHGFPNESPQAPQAQPPLRVPAGRGVETADEGLAQNRDPAVQLNLGPDQDCLTAGQVRPDCHETVFGQILQKRKSVSAGAAYPYLYASCVELSRQDPKKGPHRSAGLFVRAVEGRRRRAGTRSPCRPYPACRRPVRPAPSSPASRRPWLRW